MMNLKREKIAFIGHGVLLLVLSASVAVQAEDKRDDRILDESEYRLELEEVMVIGQIPEWKRQQQPEWSQEKFKLSSEIAPPRLRWFPEYDKDERDQYDQVRDRMGEKPLFKIFDWKFNE